MTTPPFAIIWLLSTEYVPALFIGEFKHSCSWKDHYKKWCKENNFLSMLPNNAKEWNAAEHATLQQTQVNDHFSKAQPEDKPPPYTDDLCYSETEVSYILIVTYLLKY